MLAANKYLTQIPRLTLKILTSRGDVIVYYTIEYTVYDIFIETLRLLRIPRPQRLFIMFHVTVDAWLRLYCVFYNRSRDHPQIRSGL